MQRLADDGFVHQAVRFGAKWYQGVVFGSGMYSGSIAQTSPRVTGVKEAQSHGEGKQHAKSAE